MSLVRDINETLKEGGYNSLAALGQDPDHPASGSAIIARTQEELANGLQGWVDAYKAQRAAGNVRGARETKANIDSKISELGLDPATVYGPDPDNPRLGESYSEEDIRTMGFAGISDIFRDHGLTRDDVPRAALERNKRLKQQADRAAPGELAYDMAINDGGASVTRKERREQELRRQADEALRDGIVQLLRSRGLLSEGSRPTKNKEFSGIKDENPPMKPDKNRMHSRKRNKGKFYGEMAKPKTRGFELVDVSKSGVVIRKGGEEMELSADNPKVAELVQRFTANQIDEPSLVQGVLRVATQSGAMHPESRAKSFLRLLSEEEIPVEPGDGSTAEDDNTELQCHESLREGFEAVVVNPIRTSPPWDRRRTVQAGERVLAEPATNLPSDAEIKYWLSPLPGDSPEWAPDAEGPYGVGAAADDVQPAEGPLGPRAEIDDAYDYSRPGHGDDYNRSTTN